MAAVAAAQHRRGRLRGVGRRAGPPQGWSSPGYDDRAWSSRHGRRPGRHGALHPDLRAADDIRETPSRRSACTRWPAVRWWPTSAPSTRPGRRWSSPGGSREHDHHAGRLPARSRRAGLDTARHAGDQSLLLLHHAGRETARPSRRSPTSVSATCRSTTRSSRWAGTRSWPSPGTPPCPTSPRRRSPRTTACSTPSGGSTARSCLYCSHEQFVDTPTREKGQFLWDAANESEAIMRAYGDQNMSWQGLRDVARGQARYWPDGRVNASTPTATAPAILRHLHGALPRVAVALLRRRPATRTPRVPLYPSVSRAADWIWSGAPGRHRARSTGWPTRSDGDPVYGYDLTVAADTASNVLAVNAFNRVAQLAELAGDAAGGGSPAGAGGSADRGGQRRAPAAPTASTSTARCRRRARASTPRRRPTRWRSPTAWCRRPTWRRSAPTWPVCGIDVGPNHGLELLRGLAAAGMPEAMVRTLTDTSIPGLGPHRGGGRDLHLGGLEAERPHRRLACRTVGAPPRWSPCRRPFSA